MVGEPAVAGDLLFEHDENHADGDERLLHVPDVRRDVGVGAMGDDEGVEEEEESPDDESGKDGKPASAAARQAAVEVDRRDRVDGAEIPVDGFAVFASRDEDRHENPAGGGEDGAEPALAQCDRRGGSDDEAQCDGREESCWAKDMQTVGGFDRYKRKRVEGEVEEAVHASVLAGGPDEDQAGEEVAVDDDDMEGDAGRSVRRVEDVRQGLDEGEEETKEPEVRLLLRVAAAQQQQDDDKDRQGQEIGEKGKVHEKNPCFLLLAGFCCVKRMGPMRPADVCFVT